MKATIYMYAEETKNDHSTAEGEMTVTLYEPDPGYEIIRILGKTSSQITYRDTNHAVDPFTRPSDEPVYKFDVIGDTSGNDIGYQDGDTGVTVEFNDVDVEVIQTQDCAAARVTVRFDQIEITSMDPNACAMKLELYAGNKMTTWNTTQKPKAGVFEINKTLQTIVTEELPLTVSVQGKYANLCVLVPFYAGNLGTFSITYPASSQWGAGTRQTRVAIPYDVTYHYTIQADWLP